jgi:hypothetical protein
MLFFLSISNANNPGYEFFAHDHVTSIGFQTFSLAMFSSLFRLCSEIRKYSQVTKSIPEKENATLECSWGTRHLTSLDIGTESIELHERKLKMKVGSRLYTHLHSSPRKFYSKNIRFILKARAF